MDTLSRITLRLPKDVHEQLVKRAARNLASLNSEIVRVLRTEMDREPKTAA